MDLSNVLGVSIVLLTWVGNGDLGPVTPQLSLTPSRAFFQEDHPPPTLLDPTPAQDDFLPARPGASMVYWWSNPPYVHLEDGRPARYGVAESLNESAFSGLFLPVLATLGRQCGQLLEGARPGVSNPLEDPSDDDVWGYVRLPNQLELLTQLAQSNPENPSSSKAGAWRTTLYMPFTWRAPAPTPPEDALWVVPLVESPGAVHFFRKELEPAASDLTDVIRQAWPLVIMILLGAAYSGIIIWLLDRLWNPTNFPKPFIRGFWEGFWWAFVTMTTVGYGDTTPRSIQARVFGLVWIVVGITILSVFTATVTTVLTQSALISHHSLQGIPVGVLNGSEEYSLAVALGAKAIPAGSFEELVTSMDERVTQAAIVDQYVFAFNQHLLQDNYLLDQIYPFPISHGFVMRNANTALRRCVSTYLAENRLRHVTKLADHVPPLTVRTAKSLAKSQDLFQPETVTYVFYGLAIWVVIFLVFVVWQFAFWTPKHRRRKVLKEALHGKKVDDDKTVNVRHAPGSTVTLFTRPKNKYPLPRKNTTKRRSKKNVKSSKIHLRSKSCKSSSNSGSCYVPESFTNGGFEDPCLNALDTLNNIPHRQTNATTSSSPQTDSQQLRPILERQFTEIKTFEEDFLKFRKEWVKRLMEAKVRHRKELQRDVRVRRATSLPHGRLQTDLKRGDNPLDDATAA